MARRLRHMRPSRAGAEGSRPLSRPVASRATRHRGALWRISLGQEPAPAALLPWLPGPLRMLPGCRDCWRTGWFLGFYSRSFHWFCPRIKNYRDPLTRATAPSALVLESAGSRLSLRPVERRAWQTASTPRTRLYVGPCQAWVGFPAGNPMTGYLSQHRNLSFSNVRY